MEKIKVSCGDCGVEIIQHYQHFREPSSKSHEIRRYLYCEDCRKKRIGDITEQGPCKQCGKEITKHKYFTSRDGQIEQQTLPQLCGECLEESMKSVWDKVRE